MATPTVHYASYERNNVEIYGTAELLNGHGWLFRKEGERTATLISYKDANLILFGLVALAGAQYADDQHRSGATLIACSRAN